MRIKAADYEKLQQRFREYYTGDSFRHDTESTSLQQAYALFDLPENASFSDVKRRYRELVKEHHPDIIRGKGLGEEYVRQATAKLQAINHAYRLIREKSGD